MLHWILCYLIPSTLSYVEGTDLVNHFSFFSDALVLQQKDNNALPNAAELVYASQSEVTNSVPQIDRLMYLVSPSSFLLPILDRSQ